jgi:hypothetical protein
VTRVIYIAGVGRSGSTLLGELPGVIPIGEGRAVWLGAAENRLCPCGSVFNRCEFWSAVGADAGHSWSKKTVTRMLDLEKRVARHRSLVQIAGPERGRLRAEYSAMLGMFYSSVKRVSGGNAIIDSTKDPVYASRLANAPGVEVDTVHLVRDPRAVVAAVKKIVPRPEVGPGVDERHFMPRFGAARTSSRWVVDNLLAARSSRRGRYIHVRYEDLASYPRVVIESAFGQLGLPSLNAVQLGLLDDMEYIARPHHSVGGNPIQFRQGRVTISPDDVWRSSGMGRRDRQVTDLITWPLRRRYGYD